MKYVYMNEHIRERAPTKPVIVVQGEKGTWQANTFEIRIGGVLIGHVVFDPKGLPECTTHDVKAWVEFHDSVTLMPIGVPAKYLMSPAKPKASEKKPNRKADLAP